MDVRDRFFAKVNKTETCWLWAGSRTGKGYGKILIDRKRVSAHRFSWVTHNGPIEDPKLQVCHTCDVRLCVNPAHLFLGTNSDNVRDCIAKGRFRSGKTEPYVERTHCSYGHEFTPENTAYRVRKSDGVKSQRCRACSRRMHNECAARARQNAMQRST